MEYKINEDAYLILMTINLSLGFVVMLLACLCCKKHKTPKNELLGLEGMVKLKNPDDIVVVTTIIGKSESHVDLNASSISNADSEKRASTAAHRSLPDIPIAEVNGDTGSELYETVADKRLLEKQNKSPSPNLKKQASVSQHSSISQADDISSPYSRVKNSQHDYAKVLTSEHPYAQLNAPSTLANSNIAAPSTSTNSNQHSNDVGNRSSHHSGSTQDLSNDESQVDIPAASAIAGMISASQDLPYMTPPVANQHFSGDSQDSSKGYTSISVREPLANILAQQPQIQRSTTLPRDTNDSHYATVSDDSDETYAAIDDPNQRINANIGTDIYTSGSETYAQIQPLQSVVVAVEINNTSVSSNYHEIAPQNNSSTTNSTIQSSDHSHATNWSSSLTTDQIAAIPIPPPVDSLRAQMHSRQASSSSNNSSSVGNLGSPKPEKRQANSPLPPTPKSSNILHTSSNNNLASGRNSVISVIELTGSSVDINEPHVNIVNDHSPQKNNNKSLSPSKDIEGMYAKVMKKNKLSTRDSPPSQSHSPVMTRKIPHANAGHGVADFLSNAPIATTIDTHKRSFSSNEKNRSRCNSYGARDHGYETIPADVNRKSDCYTNILQKERQQLENNALLNAINPMNSKPPNHQIDKHYETISGQPNSNDPGYATLNKTLYKSSLAQEAKPSSDYDPNYEILKDNNNSNSAGLSDDGYAKVLEKKSITMDEDSIDGYSKVKGEETEDGYSTIREFKAQGDQEVININNHNYASISEAKALNEQIQARTTEQISIATVESTTTANTTPIRSSPLSSNEHKNRPNELPPIMSPTTFNATLLLNTSSAASSANLTTTSSVSTLSSRQTPSSSQYESLTGSDTDPNYESVSYTQTNRSNSSDFMHPYERLPAENSDTQLSSPRTPPSSTDRSSFTTGAAIKINVQKNTTSSTSSTSISQSIAATSVTKTTTTNLPNEVEVDDYFQV